MPRETKEQPLLVEGFAVAADGLQEGGAGDAKVHVGTAHGALRADAALPECAAEGSGGLEVRREA